MQRGENGLKSRSATPWDTSGVAEPGQRSADVKNGTTIQSVERASALLLSIAQHPEGLTVRQLGEQHALTLPTVHNMVRTLVGVGLLSRAQERVVLGPMATIIARAVQGSDAPLLAYREGLRKLAADTGETAYLGTWRQGEIVLVDSVESTQSLRVVPRPLGSDAAAAHARSTVKVLLAYAEPEVREEMVNRMTFAAITPHTITSKDRFLAELEEIRAKGVAYDYEERLEGACCISAPIFTGDSVLSCYSIHLPALRFYPDKERLTGIVLRHAQDVSYR